MSLSKCTICGQEYYDEGRYYQLYCSNACKQKAYRIRKIQEKKAKQQTLNFTEQMCRERMSETFENFDVIFEGFRDDHGLELAIEMMYAVANLVDNFNPDED